MKTQTVNFDRSKAKTAIESKLKELYGDGVLREYTINERILSRLEDGTPAMFYEVTVMDAENDDVRYSITFAFPSSQG